MKNYFEGFPRLLCLIAGFVIGCIYCMIVDFIAR